MANIWGTEKKEVNDQFCQDWLEAWKGFVLWRKGKWENFSGPHLHYCNLNHRRALLPAETLTLVWAVVWTPYKGIAPDRKLVQGHIFPWSWSWVSLWEHSSPGNASCTRTISSILSHPWMNKNFDVWTNTKWPNTQIITIPESEEKTKGFKTYLTK